MTTTQVKQSNSLVFRTSKTIGGKDIYVSISLNDECKNGHQDFHITADIYQAGKPKTDKYWLGGGCQHEEIIKAFPQYKLFINLHGCDYEGIPTYAVENGFYHLRNGFNRTKPEDKNFKSEFCEYYRIAPQQFDVLNTSHNQLQYALSLDKLGILSQWKDEANKAIETLEQLTDTKFIVDSKKTQFHAPTQEQIAEESEKIRNGYYTPEAEAKRELIKQDRIIEKLETERDREINKATVEFEVKKQVLLIGGEKALNNCIFYSHSQTLAFNWKGYDRLSEDVVNTIISEIKLPEGIKIENKS